MFKALVFRYFLMVAIQGCLLCAGAEWWRRNSLEFMSKPQFPTPPEAGSLEGWALGEGSLLVLQLCHEIHRERSNTPALCIVFYKDINPSDPSAWPSKGPVSREPLPVTQWILIGMYSFLITQDFPYIQSVWLATLLREVSAIAEAQCYNISVNILSMS